MEPDVDEIKPMQTSSPMTGGACRILSPPRRALDSNSSGNGAAAPLNLSSLCGNKDA